MLKVLACVIHRDLLLAFRRRSDIVTTLFFFIIVVSLFPWVSARSPVCCALSPLASCG